MCACAQDKLALLRNETAAAAAADTIVLHFTPVAVDTHAIAVFFGLLSTAYSLVSIAITKNDDKTVLTPTFDATTVTGDINVVLADNLFWFLFVVFHMHHILALIVIATLDYITLFVAVTFLLTWALANRMLMRYPPALVCATLSLFAAHVAVTADLLQRGPDLWLPHTVLALTDVLFITCHLIDDVLTAPTVHNCRISYLLFAALATLSSYVYAVH